ncbi:MAG: S58 family peptidase, partial [Acidobacteriota bacterium]
MALVGLTLAMPTANAQQAERPRARDLGVKVGVFKPGALNAITDVSGVSVGQTTVIE